MLFHWPTCDFFFPAHFGQLQMPTYAHIFPANCGEHQVSPRSGINIYESFVNVQIQGLQYIRPVKLDITLKIRFIRFHLSSLPKKDSFSIFSAYVTLPPSSGSRVFWSSVLIRIRFESSTHLTLMLFCSRQEHFLIKRLPTWSSESTLRIFPFVHLNL